MSSAGDTIYAELKVKLDKEIKNKVDSAIEKWKDKEGRSRIDPLIKKDFKYSVDKFYGDYTPKYEWKYKDSDLDRWGLTENLETRSGDLGNIMRIEGNGLHLKVGFDPDLLDEHRGSKEFIYENSFVGGYHGGPIWWYPYSVYTHQGRTAKKTKAPLDIFKGRLESNTKKKIEEALENYIKKYLADSK